MNPSLFGALAATLLAALWLVGRRRSLPAAERDIGAVVALNRAQIALVRQEAAAALALEEGGEPGTTDSAQSFGGPTALALPRGDRERRLFLSRLVALGRGDAGARLDAMAHARRWGHPATLPLLRRGLRDPDPAVMREAALAIDRFRGRPVPSAPPLPGRSVQLDPLPRNVVRIR